MLVRFNAIETKVHAPTNYKGTRISASEPNGTRVYVSWDHALNADENHNTAAIELCKKMNWHGELIGGALKDSYVWVFTTRDFKAEGKA